MKIEIKTLAGSVLFEGDFSCLSEAITAAVKGGVRLAGANLEGAYLAGANLAGANLAWAYLEKANLAGANLEGAYLAGANLAGANLAWAYLEKANLEKANLARANLEGANLARANLAWANLAWANLAGAVHRFAQVAFSEHGECGRMLSAVVLKKGEEPRLFCGCFTGSIQELRDYIKDGAAHLRKTRTLALNTILSFLAVENDPEQD